MLIIGLTGSIGMGKSTTARFFAEEGVPVLDADATVHALYEGEAVGPIEAAFPGTSRGGRIDRDELSRRVVGDAAALKRLEAIVHPLVRAVQARFLAQAEQSGAPIAVLDIPLLFESGGDRLVDAVVVASAPEDVQRARTLGRPGMTVEKFETLLGKQLPDAEKRRRADFIVDTSQSFDSARAQVRAILQSVGKIRPRKDQNADARDRARHRDDGP
jgi:dephospho-CoA kinase